ncbi:MAG: hypothetical protein NVS9B4_26310 [Candidatus Acidiferrum sp.]
MDLQHVNVKLFVKNSREIDLEPLIPIFHGWIEGQVCEELLLDVADYRHVPEGPGVVLIGHEANYSVDNAGNRLGVRYNRKKILQGSNEDRLRQAVRAALTACQRLEGEPRLGGKIEFNGQEMEVSFNDRLLAPNSEETRQAVEAELRVLGGELFRGSKCEYQWSSASDRRKLFAISIRSAQPVRTADLLSNLTATNVKS